MVRSRPVYFRATASLASPFQFHIGSIKAICAALCAAAQWQFQFHIGSIKASAPWNGSVPSNFVSIPHWFDQGLRPPRRRAPPSAFQFHIGSIKAITPPPSLPCPAKFQFHIGSIKARNRSESRACATSVSIPHWFDQGSTFLPFECRRKLVSIPHWFDQGNSPATVPGAPYKVSIPHWFDQGQTVPRCRQFLNLRFNSTLVRSRLA